ncbi:hypothetical protein Fmac_017822 [Flemingia macrophylla]|uniref:Uncharacterized protein n=1 Tax=Flemingia macrophylla TaxID=520843 RepID=A0ABD1M3E7_9FABA
MGFSMFSLTTTDLPMLMMFSDVHMKWVFVQAQLFNGMRCKAQTMNFGVLMNDIRGKVKEAKSLLHKMKKFKLGVITYNILINKESKAMKLLSVVVGLLNIGVLGPKIGSRSKVNDIAKPCEKLVVDVSCVKVPEVTIIVRGSF